MKIYIVSKQFIIIPFINHKKILDFALKHIDYISYFVFYISIYTF